MLAKFSRFISFRIRLSLEKRKQERFKMKLKFCGRNVSIQQPCCLLGAEFISIDDDTAIAAFVHVWGHGGISIGKRVMIASNTSITSVTHDHTHAQMYKTIVTRPIVIEDDVWIGANSVIMPGIRLGKGCVVGAGSVVTRDVEPMSIVAGVPAKHIKSRQIQSK